MNYMHVTITYGRPLSAIILTRGEICYLMSTNEKSFYDVIEKFTSAAIDNRFDFTNKFTTKSMTTDLVDLILSFYTKHRQTTINPCVPLLHNSLHVKGHCVNVALTRTGRYYPGVSSNFLYFTYLDIYEGVI